MQLAAIDALIRLDADVPSENLKALRIGGRLDPVLVLLAKAPQEHSDVLMSLLDERLDDTEWVAVNSILWNLRPRGFAARLLRDLTIQVTVRVWDGAPGICAGDRGVFRLEKPPRDRSDFPPVLHYVLGYDMSTTIGASDIAGGPHRVFYWRHDEPRIRDNPVPRDEYRKDYLREWVHIGMPNSIVVIRWANPAKYRADAENLLASIRKWMTDVRQSLLERGLLDLSERAQSPDPEIKVEDERIDRRVPLPAIDWSRAHPRRGRFEWPGRGTGIAE